MYSSLFFFSRSLFKTDKMVGTAQLKLEALENHCDVREIIEVTVGRTQTGWITHAQTSLPIT